MRVLITGHKGLIGSELVKRFGEYHDVIGYDLGDKLPGEPVDVVFHCAAKCIIRDVINNPELMKDNMICTSDVMEYVRRYKVPKVVMFSSNRVSSDCNNPYIVCKRFNEDIVKGYHECYGIDYLIVRPETVFGVNEDTTRVIPNWISKAMNNLDLRVCGDLDKELSPLSVEAFTTKLLELFDNWDVNKNSDAYTITGVSRKVLDIIRDIKLVTNSDSKLCYSKAEKSQPQRCFKGINHIEVKEDFVDVVRNYLMDKYNKF